MTTRRGLEVQTRKQFFSQNKNATFLRFIKCFPLLYVGYTDSPVASVALKHVYIEESLINPVRVFPFLEPWRWIISWWSRSLSMPCWARRAPGDAAAALTDNRDGGGGGGERREKKVVFKPALETFTVNPFP